MIDKDYLKAYISSYAKSSLKQSPDDKTKYFCPICNKPTLSISKKINRFKCFNPSCVFTTDTQTNGDIFDLVEIQTGLTDFQDKISYLESYIKDKKLKVIPSNLSQIEQDQNKDKDQEKKIPILDFNKLNQDFLSSERALNQIKFRKMNDETIKRIKFGYGKSTILKNKKVIFIPFPEDNYFMEWNFNFDVNKLPKYLNPTERKKIPFNYGIIGKTEKPIFIVEGIFDCLSLLQEGFESVAICGSGISFILNYIKDHRPKNNIILLFDKDNAGTSFKNDFIAFLIENKIIYFEAKIIQYMESKLTRTKIKDPNEAYKIKPEMFISLLRTTENNANKYFNLYNKTKK